MSGTQPWALPPPPPAGEKGALGRNAQLQLTRFFYLVWTPSCSRSPKHIHVDRDSAEREADRLAKEHPLCVFYVVVTLSSVVMAPPRRQELLGEDDVPDLFDRIPF